MTKKEPAAENPGHTAKESTTGMLTPLTKDGELILQADRGTAIPARLKVVDDSGTVVAVYTAGEAAQVQSRSSSPNDLWEIPITYATQRDPE